MPARPWQNLSFMPAPRFVLLRNASVYAPEVLGVVDLLVVDGIVTHIGGGLNGLPGWIDADEVDLDGRVVVPALVDGHVHATGGGGEAGPGSRIPPPPASAYRAAGVGTVIGVLGTDDLTRTPQSLVAWTRELGAQNLHAYCHTGGYHLPPATITGSVRSDIVWIDSIIGVGEVAVSDHRSSQPTPVELRKVAAEAHVAGLLTGKAGVLHLHVGDGTAGLEPVRAAMHGSELPARVFNPTHLNRRKALLDEALELAGRGSWVDFTAFPVEEDEEAYAAAEALTRFLERGGDPGRVSVSSDAGGCLPVFDHEGQVERFDVGASDAMLQSLRECVAAGLTLEDALPAFTSNPARLLSLSVGRIAVGSSADLLVLGSATDDHPAFTLDAVMLQGTWFGADGEALAELELQEDLVS